MNRKLSDEEREFNKSPGVPFSRLIPYILIIIMIIISAFDESMFQICLGRPLTGGRAAGAASALLAVPCSWALLRGSWLEMALFAGIWLPLPFAIINLFWMRRQKEFWSKKRAREKCRKSNKDIK